MANRIRVVLFLASSAAMPAVAGTDQSSAKLCPNVIASLMTVPGNLDSTVSGQRVEIRQCPLDIRPGKGWVQLVAWRKGEKTPALIYDAEDSGLRQMVMIEGVYVFEFMGGLASRTVAIVFKDGDPRIGMEDGSRYKTTISADDSKVVVEVWESDELRRRYEFRRSDSGARR